MSRHHERILAQINSSANATNSVSKATKLSASMMFQLSISVSFCTHQSKPIWHQVVLYTRNKGYTKSVLHLYTGKLWLEGGFLFSVQNRVCRLATDFEYGFHRKLFRHSIHWGRPLTLLGIAYLVTLKVGTTHTYANKNEGQVTCLNVALNRSVVL